MAWYDNLLGRKSTQPENKQHVDLSEQKSYAFDYPFSFAEFLEGRGVGDLRAVECIRLWKQCMPFYTAVNKRSESFSSIPPKVYDVENEEFVNDHPVLELLAKPNPLQSYLTFAKEYASFWDICGESFLVATGDQGREPLELFIAKPQEITEKASASVGSIGFVGAWLWNNAAGAETYRLDDMELDGTFRYWNTGKDRELWQAKDFNPNSGRGNHRGFPKASPLWLQIQQFIEADTNNWSILKRGGRPSLAWIWKHNEPMTNEQYERWKEQVKAYEGAINAGRQVILDNMELEDLGVNNKDMEFSVNKRTVKQEIFTAYDIPLSLVSAETMTMDNLKTGSLLLFDNAVLPMADNLFAELTRFLMPRYPDSENMIITYNASDIPAIRERLLAETERQAKLNVLTDNEIRSEIGREPLQGGDVVFKPVGEIPVEVDDFTGDNLDKPDPQLPEDKQTPRQLYFERMQSIQDEKGQRMFTDEEIAIKADKYGFK